MLLRGLDSCNIILDYIDFFEMKSFVGKDIGRDWSVEYLDF